jgi:hypothetical protein
MAYRFPVNAGDVANQIEPARAALQVAPDFWLA